MLYSLVFYVPEDHCECVKRALFEKGAGRYGKYDSCSWQVKGDGQYRPLKGSDPFLGTEGEVEKVSEYRVEMVCREEFLKDVIEELIKVHPYEEVAYHVWAVKTVEHL